MKKLLLILLLASPAMASQKYGFKDPHLDDEFSNNYKEHSFPTIVNGRASTMTVTQLNVSTITLIGSINLTSLNLTTGTIRSFMVVGAGSSEDAPIGRVGQSTTTTNTVTVVTTQYTTITSIPLTSGKWSVSWRAFSRANTSLVEVLCGIATVTNTNTGHVLGDTAFGFPASGTYDGSTSCPSYVALIVGSVTYYLTCQSFGANSSTTGTISAIRIF